MAVSPTYQFTLNSDNKWQAGDIVLCYETPEYFNLGETTRFKISLSKSYISGWLKAKVSSVPFIQLEDETLGFIYGLVFTGEVGLIKLQESMSDLNEVWITAVNL